MTDQKHEPEADRAPDGTFLPEDEVSVPAAASGVTGLIAELRQRADAAEAEGTATARVDARYFRQAVDALAIANTGGLKLLYEIRRALGWTDKHGLSLLPDGVWDVTRREAECQAILARIRKVRDGYAAQAKFADVDPASYFREFIRRLDAAVENKGA